MRTSRSLALLVLILAFGTSAHAHQTASRPSGIFKQLFPNPSGQNAMEDFVKAGDIARNTPAWLAYEFEYDAKKKTFAVKRRLVEDPGVRRALAAVRLGLKKPSHPIHGVMTSATVFPEMALFRSLARLIAVVIYVELADGRVNQALGWLEDTLRFGYMLQHDSLISGLVAIAIDAIAIRLVGDHLEQLSAHDCDRLRGIVTAWLKLPDPAIRIIEGEREMAQQALREYRSEPAKIIDIVETGEEGSTEKQALDTLRQTLENNPMAARSVLDQVGARISAHYGRLLNHLRKPVWDREEFSMPPGDGTAAQRLFDALVPNSRMLTDGFLRDQAKVQLLGVHAAIHRYRWEYNRLPDTLEQLALGKLAYDPFSKQPLVYKRLSEWTYDLSSVGPIDTDGSGSAPSGTRIPIRISSPKR